MWRRFRWERCVNTSGGKKQAGDCNIPKQPKQCVSFHHNPHPSGFHNWTLHVLSALQEAICSEKRFSPRGKKKLIHIRVNCFLKRLCSKQFKLWRPSRFSYHLLLPCYEVSEWSEWKTSCNWMTVTMPTRHKWTPIIKFHRIFMHCKIIFS